MGRDIKRERKLRGGEAERACRAELQSQIHEAAIRSPRFASALVAGLLARCATCRRCIGV